MLERLRWTLQALAQPAEIQLTLFPSFVCVPDELALEFEQHYCNGPPSDRALWSASQLAALHKLDALLESMSGHEHAGYWTLSALRDSDLWVRVRRLAMDSLVEFGWPAAPPPSAPCERGSVYLGPEER